MKKVAFSAVFIILFGAYVFSQKLNPPETLPTNPPAQVEAAPLAQTAVPTIPTENEGGPQDGQDEGASQVLPTQTAPASTVKTTPSTKTAPVVKPTPTPAPVKTVGQYKDGTYTGISADATYGNIQTKVIISGGKITDVQFLDSPHSRSYSIQVNSIAKPLLAQEAIQAQNAQVNGVSGATFSSGAFIQSLTSALAQAK